MRKWGLASLASCAWFFDEISRLEPVNGLTFALRAMIQRFAFTLLTVLLLAACASNSDTALRQAVKDHPDVVLDALGQRKTELFALVMPGASIPTERSARA